LSSYQKKFGIKAEWLWAYLFIAPMILGVCIFSIGPIFYSFAISFTRWDGMSKPVFTGTANYILLFRDLKIVGEIRNTFIFVAVVVPVSLALSLLTAALLNKDIKGRSAFRVIYYLPNIAMPVAIASVWKLLYNSKYGLINQFLGLFSLPQPTWLTSPKLILWAIIIVSVWSNLGYNTVILLAALQNVPPVLYEAAMLDGTKPHAVFRHITFPMISPTIFFLLTTATMNAMRVFDIILAFSSTSSDFSMRGPLLDGFRTIVFGIYEKAFTNLQMGLASAEAVFLFIIIAAVTLVQFHLQKKWVNY
jgi:multiple sugar transport system permease protein